MQPLRNGCVERSDRSPTLSNAGLYPYARSPDIHAVGEREAPRGGNIPDRSVATTAFYTIGHSTRPLAEFVALLERNGVELVVDVRTVPRSHTNPQYDRDALARGLREAGIGYEPLPALGGLRGRQRDVPPETNAFWDNASFHNYADYAMSAAFRAGLERLRALGAERRCAIMCAEAVWWRCHRRIIADYLLHDGEAVLHIVSPERVEPARMTPAATPAADGTLAYPRAA